MLIFVIDHEKSRLTQLVQQISEAARAARDAKILEYASAVTAGDKRYDLPKGTHFLAPADCGDLRFEGDMMLIVSHL